MRAGSSLAPPFKALTLRRPARACGALRKNQNVSGKTGVNESDSLKAPNTKTRHDVSPKLADDTFSLLSLKSVRITQQSRAIRPKQLAMSAFVDASLRAHYRVQVRTVVVLRRPALGEWPPVASSCCQRCIKVVSSRPVRVAGGGPLTPCSAPPRTWLPGPRSSRGRRTLACPPSPCSRRGKARRRRRRREQRRR